MQATSHFPQLPKNWSLKYGILTDNEGCEHILTDNGEVNRFKVALVLENYGHEVHARTWNAGVLPSTALGPVSPKGSQLTPVRELHISDSADADALVPELRDACQQMLDFIEMNHAHRGLMSVEEILCKLEDNRKHLGVITISHHIGCAKTTRHADLPSIRKLLAKANS